MQDVSELVKGNSDFAFDLYQAVGNRPGNLIFSPFSLSYALGMTYAGARGETARQMANTLHFKMPPERFHPLLGGLARALIQSGDPFQGTPSSALRIANAIWAQEGYPFLKPFLDQLSGDYSADLKRANFAGAHEKARLDINKWVAEQTEDKIQDLIAKGVLDSLTRLVLTNAIYFLGKWSYPFSKSATSLRTFYRLDGSTIETSMMSQSEPETYSYVQRDRLQVLALPYKDRRLEMVICCRMKGSFPRFRNCFPASGSRNSVNLLGPDWSG